MPATEIGEVNLFVGPNPSAAASRRWGIPSQDATVEGADVRVYSLSDLFADPALLAPPVAVVPHLAWPGRVTLLAGREKLGKSTLITHAIAALSVGRPFLSERTESLRTLFVTEEALGDVARRFKDATPEPDLIDLVEMGALGESPLERIDRIEAIVANDGYGLVVIDTLAVLLSGIKDFNSAAECTPPLNALVASARRYNVAVILSHHATKGAGGYRDSTAIGATVDVIIELTETPDSSTGRTCKVRGRLGTQDFAVRLDAEVGYVLVTQDDSSPQMRVLDFIRENPCCSKREVRAGVIGGNQAIDNALRELTERGLIQHERSGQLKGYSPTPTGARAAVVGAEPESEEDPEALPGTHEARARHVDGTGGRQLGTLAVPGVPSHRTGTGTPTANAPDDSRDLEEFLL